MCPFDGWEVSLWDKQIVLTHISGMWGRKVCKITAFRIKEVPGVSSSCRDCNRDLIILSILNVIQVFPLEVSVSGFSGTLKSPPMIKQPEVKPCNTLITCWQNVTCALLGYIHIHQCHRQAPKCPFPEYESAFSWGGNQPPQKKSLTKVVYPVSVLRSTGTLCGVRGKRQMTWWQFPFDVC